MGEPLVLESVFGFLILTLPSVVLPCLTFLGVAVSLLPGVWRVGFPLREEWGEWQIIEELKPGEQQTEADHLPADVGQLAETAGVEKRQNIVAVPPAGRRNVNLDAIVKTEKSLRTRPVPD